jgi:hypothetical protein
LLEEAKQAGLELELPASGFESVVLASNTQAPTVVTPSHVLASIERLPEPRARALRVLELLAAAAGARAGHLYYVQRSNLVRVASLTAPPDPMLDKFANDYLQQRLEFAAMTTLFTEMDEPAVARVAMWTSHSGDMYRVPLLQREGKGACLGLVALCGAAESLSMPEYRSLSNAISARLLELGEVG